MCLFIFFILRFGYVNGCAFFPDVSTVTTCYVNVLNDIERFVRLTGFHVINISVTFECLMQKNQPSNRLDGL